MKTNLIKKKKIRRSKKFLKEEKIKLLKTCPDDKNICSTCLETFDKTYRTPNVLYENCEVCRNKRTEYDKKKYQKHKNNILLQKKENYKQNREIIRDKQKEYYDNNASKILEHKKEVYNQVS